MPGKSRKSICVPALLFLVILAGCAAPDAVGLVEKTLDARQKALKNKDVEAYVALFHPDYVYKSGQVETITSQTVKRFQIHDSILLQTFNRRISFEQDGEIARVVQEYRIITQRAGKTASASGTEHFLLKRQKGLIKTRFLFFQGLGV